MHVRHRRAVEHAEPDPGGRVVVEPSRVADRLHPERVADTAPDALAVRDVAEAAGERPQVERAAVAIGRQREVAQVLEELAHRRGAVGRLAVRKHGALDERVAQAQLEGVDAQGGGELVDGGLDGVAGLHGTEARAWPRTAGCW